MPLVRSRRGAPSLEHAVESSGSPASPKRCGFDPSNLTGGLTRCRVTRSPLVGFLAPAIDTPSRRCWPVRRPTRDHPWFLTTSTAIRRQGCGLVASHCRSEVHRVSCLRALTDRSRSDTRDIPRCAPTPRRTSVCDSQYASLRLVSPSQPGSRWLWLPATHPTPSFLGLFPLRGSFSLAVRQPLPPDARPTPKSLP